MVTARVGRRGAERDVGQAVLTGRGRLGHFSLSVAAPVRGFDVPASGRPDPWNLPSRGQGGGGVLFANGNTMTKQSK